ncbi:hypothetical protein PISMIDRAFT_18452 [Pisolithus microcarpus 441]|uniref:Uncharacterized protein n=1 Tax=Pisolithus microcarpus 441 TaxID=765257 RepID=A0A0C9YR35_9AGAM|nr:hypothetical protein PISMIDRAFT_18452 [Pisolithus microcarpus 441]
MSVFAAHHFQLDDVLEGAAADMLADTTVSGSSLIELIAKLLNEEGAEGGEKWV